jgi:hypothetical protein
MNNNIRFAIVGLSVLSMSACTLVDNQTSENLYYPAYASYDNSQLYMQSNYGNSSSNYKYNYSIQPPRDVIVPDSYHVGDMRSPTSFHERDEEWVRSQSPQAYTIELANGEKASKVAQALYKAPKQNRMAQVKYQRNGKNYYSGVYGSYKDAADAQKALSSLPADLRNGATVKSWSSVQQ